jgi:hypothetical protein
MNLTPEQVDAKLKALATLTHDKVSQMVISEIFKHLEFIADLVDVPDVPESRDVLYNPLMNFLASVIEQYPYARSYILNVAQKPSGKSQFDSLPQAAEEGSLRCEQTFIFEVNGKYILHPYKDAYPDHKIVWQNC